MTLEKCAQTDHVVNTNYAKAEKLHTLILRPCAIWIGSCKMSQDERVLAAYAYDSRLTGFFGQRQIVRHRSFAPELAEVFAKTGNPRELWAVHAPTGAAQALCGTDFTVAIDVEGTSSFSATEGSSFHSLTRLRFAAEKPKFLQDFSDTIWRFGQILSIFSLECLRFQAVIYHLGSGEKIGLCWQLGEKRNAFNPPMQHQVLLDFSDPSVLKIVCEKWFQADKDEHLSRWLFCRALAETDDRGLARFVAVAQSLETLGRKFQPTPKKTRNEMNRIADLIQDALSATVDQQFVARIVGLVKSSNHSSFRDVIAFMIEKSWPHSFPVEPESIKKLAKEIAEVRNAVAHMGDGNSLSLETAFSRINKLSLKMAFWYAMIQAHMLGVQPQDPGGFHLNNRNARHGLPNDLLESL